MSKKTPTINENKIEAPRKGADLFPTNPEIQNIIELVHSLSLTQAQETHSQQNKRSSWSKSIKQIFHDIQAESVPIHRINKEGKTSLVGFAAYPDNYGKSRELVFKYTRNKKNLESEIETISSGIDEYNIYKLIQKHTNIKVPETVLATDKLLVSESIPGKTLKTIIANTSTDEEMDHWNYWWRNKMKEQIRNQVQYALDNKDPRTQINFTNLDIHTGNIIVSPEWTKTTPPETDEEFYKYFTLIDPIT